MCLRSGRVSREGHKGHEDGKRMKDRFTVLVVGGARSGKSQLAQRLAEHCFRVPLYLATAEVTDEEMRERIELHRKARGENWLCVEEPLDIAGVISGPGESDGILLDCVTVWLGNVLHHEGIAGLEERKRDLLESLHESGRSVIIVSNELGQGIVPIDPETRLFRDQAGWLNQDLAKAADIVISVTCGLPMILKGKELMDSIGGLE